MVMPVDVPVPTREENAGTGDRHRCGIVDRETRNRRIHVDHGILILRSDGGKDHVRGRRERSGVGAGHIGRPVRARPKIGCRSGPKTARHQQHDRSGNHIRVQSHGAIERQGTPLRVAPVVKVMLVSAMMVPIKELFVPRVAELPTSQKMSAVDPLSRQDLRVGRCRQSGADLEMKLRIGIAPVSRLNVPVSGALALKR